MSDHGALEKTILDFLQYKVGHENISSGNLERGLERLRPIFQPYCQWVRDHKVKVITVGGTNGKGETVYHLAKMLQGKQHFAMWISPHIKSVRERITFSNELLPYQEWIDGIHQTFEQLRTQGVILSYYEFLFYFFLKKSRQQQVSLLILEVGMGGRLDAVNLLDADICAITSIGRDHQEYLGATYRDILKEKIGITRLGRPCVTALQGSYLNQLMEKHQKSLEFSWRPVVHDASYHSTNAMVASKIFQLLYPQSPLDHSHHNISKETGGFIGRNEYWPVGEKHGTSMGWRFVGAHNLAGMRAMMKDDLTRGEIKCDELLISFSKRSDSDILHMLKLVKNYLCKYSGDVHCSITGFRHVKAYPANDLQAVMNHVFGGALGLSSTVSFYKDIDEYFSEKIYQQFSNILVCGSYYFIGYVQSLLSEEIHS